MPRNHNTNKHGIPWTDADKRNVWNKANIVEGHHQTETRMDPCGNLIKWSQFGNRDSIYGWEIDHVNPVANGGGDNIENLQPLHWRNNLKKGNRLFWKQAT